MTEQPRKRGRVIVVDDLARAHMDNAARLADELRQRSEQIDLEQDFTPDQLVVLRRQAALVTGVEDVDSLIRIQTQRFSELPEDDPQKTLGLNGFVDNVFTNLAKNRVS